MSLDECRRCLQEEEGVEYTKEEIESIREYVYLLAEVIYTHYQRETQQQQSSTAIIINLEHHETDAKSHSLHPGLHR